MFAEILNALVFGADSSHAIFHVTSATEVVEGMDVLRKMEAQGSSDGKTKNKVTPQRVDALLARHAGYPGYRFENAITKGTNE